jgi:transposase
MLSKEVVIVINHYLHEGLSKSATARKLGVNRSTIHRYLKSGKDSPRYEPRSPQPSVIDPFKDYMRGRLERRLLTFKRRFLKSRSGVIIDP